jgi:hypothetical protein
LNAGRCSARNRRNVIAQKNRKHVTQCGKFLKTRNGFAAADEGPEGTGESRKRVLQPAVAATVP